MKNLNEHIYTFENLLHLANDKIHQPENSYRDLRNAHIVDEGNSEYSVRTMGGNVFSAALPDGYSPIGFCQITEEIFGIFLINGSGTERIGYISTASGTPVYTNSYTSSSLGFDLDKPIECLGYYISSDEIWVHWVQKDVQPRVINIGIDNTGLDEDMLNYSPELNWPQMEFSDEIEGDLLHGTYFFFVQYIGDNGVRTDYSLISSPIKISGEGSGALITDYQDYTGEDPDKTTGKGLELVFENVDTDYNKMRIGFFFSNGKEVYQNGVLAAEETIGGLSTVTVEITSMLGYDIVLLQDVLLFNSMIQEARAIEFVKNYNVLGNVKLREELDLESSMSPYISPSKYEILADVLNITETFDYPLFAHDQSEAKVYPGIWYRVKDTSAVGASFTGAFKEMIKGTCGPDSATDEIHLETIHQELDTYYNGDGIVIEYMSSNGTRATHETTVSAYTASTNLAELTTNISGGVVSYIGYTIYHSVTDPAYIIGDYFMLSSYAIVNNVATEHVEPMLRVKKYYNHSTGNQIYDNYSLDGQWRDYKNTVISEKCGTYKELDKVAFAAVFFDLHGKPFYARDLGIVEFPDIGTDNQRLQGWEYDASDDYYEYYNHRLNNIVINNLDITDIADKVSGMLIVRTPVERTIKSEGLLHPFYYSEDGTDWKFRLLNNFMCQGNGNIPDPGGPTGEGFAPNIYMYKSAELLFGLEKAEIENNSDEIELAGYLQADYPDYSGTVDNNPALGWTKKGMTENDKKQGFFQKMYRYTSRESANTNGDIGTKRKILDNTTMSPAEKIEKFYPKNVNWDFWNITAVPNIPIFFGAGAKSHILRLDNGDVKNNYINDFLGSIPKIPHIRVRSSKKDPDSIIGPSSTRRYVNTGRYIHIDSTFLSNIQDGASYIIDGLEVYGGDCFASLWDFVMWYPDEDRTSNEPYGHSLIMPITSEINMSMRHGRHIAKDRTYRSSVYTPNGLRHKEDSYNFEQYKYNFGYSSREIENAYPAIPLNYEDDKFGHLSYIWSEKKEFGEVYDSWRIFKTANRVTLPPYSEEVIGLENLYNSLIVFCPNNIYYVPVGERVIVGQGEGYEVQIGSGTEFVNTSQRSQILGCSDKFAVLKMESSVIFYDNRRKCLCEISASGQKALISNVLGMREYLKYATLSSSGGSPYNGKGFILYYDSTLNKVLFLNLDDGGSNQEVMHYHPERKRITGFDQRLFTVGFASNENFYTIPGEPWRSIAKLPTNSITHNIFLENQHGTLTLYGDAFESEIHLILNKDPRYDKIFDSYELIIENHAPIEMDVITKDGTKTIEWSTLSTHDIARTYASDVRNSLWGNFPFFSRKRTRGKYIELKIRSTTITTGGIASLGGIIVKSRKAL